MKLTFYSKPMKGKTKLIAQRGIKESVPLDQVTRDNPHGTNWKWLDDPAENGIVSPCACNGECTNQGRGSLGRCENCGVYYCNYCNGFRAWHTYVCDEGYWATYGYKASDNEWYIWAN